MAVYSIRRSCLGIPLAGGNQGQAGAGRCADTFPDVGDKGQEEAGSSGGGRRECGDGAVDAKGA